MKQVGLGCKMGGTGICMNYFSHSIDCSVIFTRIDGPYMISAWQIEEFGDLRR